MEYTKRKSLKSMSEEEPKPPKKVQKGEALWLMSFSDMSLVVVKLLNFQY